MNCPHCTTELLALKEYISKDDKVKEGDLTFCLECSECSIFTYENGVLELRRPKTQTEKLECEVAVGALFEKVTESLNSDDIELS